MHDVMYPFYPSKRTQTKQQKGMRFHLRNRLRMKIGKKMIAQAMDGDQRERDRLISLISGMIYWILF